MTHFRFDEKDLKPCPFCGEKEDIRVTNWGLWRFWCAKCLAKSCDKLSEKEAIEAWNRRTDNG